MVVGYFGSAPIPLIPPSASCSACFHLWLPVAHHHTVPLCSSHHFGVLPLFSSVGASLTPSLLSVVLAVIQPYYSISCLGLTRNLNITALVCCCSEDPLLSAMQDAQLLIKIVFNNYWSFFLSFQTFPNLIGLVTVTRISSEHIFLCRRQTMWQKCT